MYFFLYNWYIIDLDDIHAVSMLTGWDSLESSHPTQPIFDKYTYQFCKGMVRWKLFTKFLSAKEWEHPTAIILDDHLDNHTTTRCPTVLCEILALTSNPFLILAIHFWVRVWVPSRSVLSLLSGFCPRLRSSAFRISRRLG